MYLQNGQTIRAVPGTNRNVRMVISQCIPSNIALPLRYEVKVNIPENLKKQYQKDRLNRCQSGNYEYNFIV